MKANSLEVKRVGLLAFMSRKSRRTRFRSVGATALKEDIVLQAAEDMAARIDIEQEYVAGYGQAYSPLNRTIPSQAYDPNAPEVTFETYRQMLNDPEVSSSVRTVRDAVLADGIQIRPAFNGAGLDDDAPEFNQAQEIADFCERNLLGLKKSLKTTLEGMVESAIVYGHKVAEIVWKPGTGDNAGRIVLDKLSLKNYRTLDFVIDQYWNHLGFVARTPGRGRREIIAREKFLLLTLHEEDEDPRGRSSIRSSYTAWTFKQLVWPEYKRWLDNCALPTTVGKLAPKQPGDVQRNADGSKTSGGRQLSPAEAFGQALRQLKNAGYVVIPNGAEVDQLAVVGEGAGFERAIDVADSQIGKGIQHQTLATSEARFGTRAQSETHMGVLDQLIWWLKGKVAEAITGDLLRQVIRYNYGDDALRFLPLVSLGDTERRDWSVDATAAAALEPSLTDSQWNAITTQLGVPPPLPGEQPRRQARQSDQAGVVEQPVERPNAPPGQARFRTQARFVRRIA